MARLDDHSSIRRQLIAIILITSTAVLALTCTILFGYEFVTFRRTMAEELTTLAKVIATNSTAALAFENNADAQEILAALRAEPTIVAAALYRKDGSLFSYYAATT